MKVICVDATPNQFGKLLKEGKVYNTTGDAHSYIDGHMGYLLQEVQTPKHPIIGFKKSRFIPLSEIDEMELIETRNEELVA